MTDWDDYRYAAAVAEAGTVRGAAKLLGVHASTVTRRLDHFERRVGVKLFTRGARGLMPTTEGLRIVGALDAVTQQLGDLERRLLRERGEMAGEVRLDVSPLLAPALFMPAIKRLLDAHPALSVQQCSRWTADEVLRREVDIALLVLQRPPDDLVGRPAGALSLAAWARPELAERWPAGCPWLPSRLQQVTAPELRVDDAPLGGFIDTPALQLGAVQAGLGASLLPCSMAAGDPRLRELPAPRVGCEVWVLSHPDARGVNRVQALALALADALRERDLDAPI